MENYSLSKHSITRASAPHTCQAERSLRGFGVVTSPWYHSWLTQWLGVYVGTWGHHCHVQTGAGTGREHSRAGSAHPCPSSILDHGPKNICNRVSKRKRNGKVKCHDLRHALRLLFSWPSLPSLGPPMAFPDQKQPGRTPWAQPSAVASAQGILPFIPPHPPSCRLQPAPALPGGKHQWAPRAPSLSPCCSHLIGPTVPSMGAPARAILILGCLSPTLYQVGAGRHPEFSFH